MMKDKTVLVIGFTKRTSYALSKALLRMGAKVAVSDLVSNDEKRELLASLNGGSRVLNYLGRQDIAILDEVKPDFVMPSPGAPLSIPIIAEAARRGVEIIGDIELFWRLHPEAVYVGITGTDGKTTTTTLTYEIVRRERGAVVGGNIGSPVFESDEKVAKDTVVVLELSSFQLETIDKFRPNVSALLNVAADHLDRYPDIETYRTAKERIFLNQTPADTAVLNRDCSYYEASRKAVKAKTVTFSRKDPSADCCFDGKTIFLGGKPYIERSAIQLKGVHNVENAMAAILMSKALGISDDTIRSTLEEFTGLPHRLEFVRSVNGVEFYNDSKATTVNAMEKALQSFETPVVLIAGGRDKGLDFGVLKKLVLEKVKTVVLIGEAADKIDRAFAHPDTVRAGSMDEAAKLALSKAVPGGAVVLSPGCASYDWYKNYEERGDDFKRAVEAL